MKRAVVEFSDSCECPFKDHETGICLHKSRKYTTTCPDIFRTDVKTNIRADCPLEDVK